MAGAGNQHGTVLVGRMQQGLSHDMIAGPLDVDHQWQDGFRHHVAMAHSDLLEQRFADVFIQWLVQAERTAFLVCQS